jgi:hypothetical protein
LITVLGIILLKKRFYGVQDDSILVIGRKKNEKGRWVMGDG